MTTNQTDVHNPYTPMLLRAAIALILTLVAAIGSFLYFELPSVAAYAILALYGLAIYRYERLIRQLLIERDAYEDARRDEQRERALTETRDNANTDMR